MTHTENHVAETPIPAFVPLLSDEEVAEILVMTTVWVRSHAARSQASNGWAPISVFVVSVEHWLGSLDHLLEVETVATLLRVPQSWVYANADEIPGVLRLGRYVRFRPAIIHSFLSGSEVVQ